MLHRPWLTVNRRLTMRLEREKYENAHPSRIEAVEEESIAVAAPLNRGVPLRVPIDDRVTVSVMDGEGIYEFTTSVKGQVAAPLPLLMLAHPVRVSRHQRRAFVRVPEVLECKLYPHDVGQTDSLPHSEGDGTPLHSVPDYGQPLDSFSLNLSAGGILVAVSEMDSTLFTIGKVYDVEFALPPNNRRLRLRSRVVRREKRQTAEGFYVALEFRNVPEPDRRTLLRHTFERQADLRRRGLL